MAENRYQWLIRLFNDGQQLGTTDAAFLGKTVDMQLLLKDRLLVQAGNQGSILCPFCNNPHDVLVDPITFTGYCPDAGAVTATPGMVTSHAVNHPRLFEILRTALGAPISPPTREVSPDMVWFIGESRIGPKMVPVYLVRSPYGNVDKPKQYFHLNPGNKPGLALLTFSPPAGYSLPHGHRPVALNGLLEEAGEVFSIDGMKLERIWEGSTEGQPTLGYSPDFHSVTYYGKTHIFRGKQQQKVVACLIKAYESGQPVVRTSEMMDKLGMDSTKQLPHLFKSHKTWRNLISYGQPRGTCRIREL